MDLQNRMTKELLEEIVGEIKVFGKPDLRFRYLEGDVSYSNVSELTFSINLTKPKEQRVFLKTFVLMSQENKDIQLEVLRKEFLKEVLTHAIFGFPALNNKLEPYIPNYETQR